MKVKFRLVSLFAFLVFSLSVFSLSVSSSEAYGKASPNSDLVPYNILEELDPFDPYIEQTLREYDEIYEKETGMSAHLDEDLNFLSAAGCYRKTCDVYVYVSKAEQKMYLYLNGRLDDVWLVSTGVPGHGTPDFDRHPNGRIYEAYTSSSYPGGNYKGLGNMPYAVFIQGGFAIHGTPRSNWPYLGQKASHGCIRLHPDYGKRFNRLVRSVGIRNVWITVD